MKPLNNILYYLCCKDCLIKPICNEYCPKYDTITHRLYITAKIAEKVAAAFLFLVIQYLFWTIIYQW
jgi:sulfatase maturation enzyme AslB (radical SAM superfamily)